MKNSIYSKILSTCLIGLGIFSSFSVTASNYNEGTNLAANAVISEYTSQQNATNSVSNLIDTDTSTRWSAEGFPQSAVIDLGDNYGVNGVNLVPYKNRAYNFVVEGSTDGNNFVTLTTSLENTSETDLITKMFESTTVRYVKLTVVGAKGYTGQWVSINELEVLYSGEVEEPTTTTTTCEAGSNLSTQGAIETFSSEQNTTNNVNNLIDGNTTNRWSAEGFPQSAVIDLGEVYNVNELNLFPFRNRAYQYIIEGSLEANSNFTTLVNATGNTQGASELNSKFEEKAVRYVKLTVTGAHNYTGTWVSINDLQIKCAGTPVVPTENTPEEVEDQLVISKHTFNTSVKAKFKTVTVTSNTNWNVTESSSWLSITNASGSNSGEFQINIDQNSSTSPRTAEVTVSTKDLQKTITINQEGEEEVIVEQTPTTGTLDPNHAPSENFDLSEWYLSVPVDRGDGIATSIKPAELNDSYEHNDFFYTGNDGAMVFVNYPKDAVKTSENTSYSRCELRELLDPTSSISYQGVNKNNWVFGNSSNEDKQNAGGVDGILRATLSVDRVTETATSTVQRGRTIIGQIHASKNEPCRLYYHKLPQHNKGVIYVAHETRSGDETFHNMIGNYVKETGSGAGDLTSSNPSEPTDGIELGEKFSYEIKVVYDVLYVTISREGKSDIVEEIDMSDSDYAGDWMYFKAGVYTQNKTCTDSNDYDKASFYSLTQSHDNSTASSKNISTAHFNTKVIAYPNPFVSQLNVTTTLKAGLGYSITLLNTNGKVVQTQSIENDVETLNLANITNGLYILQIIDPNNQINEIVKVVKN